MCVCLINLLNFGFSSPINVPTIDVLTNDTPFAIGTANDISNKKKKICKTYQKV